MQDLYGWTGKIALVNLSDASVQILPTAAYLDRYIGGRGIGARLYYDFVGPDVTAFAPENSLILMTGPLVGSPALACSRIMALFKSPQLFPEQCGIASLGGDLPVQLKSAGYDGLVITGTSRTPCYLIINNETIAVHSAEALWGLDTLTTREKLTAEHGSDVETLCIGPAGEKLIRFSVAVAAKGSAVAHGFGAVMGSKQLKAIAVRGSGKVAVAYPDRLKELNRSIRRMVKGRILMDPMIGGIELVRRTPCRGCPAGCSRGVYRHISGSEEYRKNCASAYFYYDCERDHNNGNPGEQSFLATSLCDRLGLCTQELGKLLNWLNTCFGQSLITEDSSGLQWSQLGTPDFFKSFADMLISRKGLGDILAEGVIRSAHALGKPAVELLDGVVEGSGFSADLYNGRYFLTNAVLHATDRINPMISLHEIVYPLFKWVLWYATDGSMSQVSTKAFLEIARKFWINEQAVDFSTYEGKGAVAAHIQNREYAKETLVACDFFYPIVTPEGTDDHVGDPSIESRLLAAVTGLECSEQDYYRIGERVFNLQRIIAVREGHRGRRDDILPEFNFSEPLEVDRIYFGMFNPEFMLPGPGGELITRKGARLEHDKFDAMMDEYYLSRGWDLVTGMPNRAKLQDLELNEFKY